MLLKDGEFVFKYGVLQGFDGVVWAIVVLNGLGGLLVAATMKYADNIAKCFAAGLSIVSGTVLSMPLFGFLPSSTFGMGASCTVLASVLYSLAPEQFPCNLFPSTTKRSLAHEMDSAHGSINEDELSEDLVESSVGGLGRDSAMMSKPLLGRP